MVALSLYSSGTPTTSGTWATPTNATGTNNATFAALTLAAKSATGYINLPYATQTLSGGSTISAATATIWSYVANTTYISAATAQLMTSTGTAIGAAVTLTRSTTTTTSQSVTFPTLPTVAQVNAGLQIQLTATHATNSTTSATFNVDAAQLNVTYTLPAPPIVDAGVDATFEVNTTFIRTAGNTGGAADTQAWTITAGPTGVGSTLSTTASLSWTPTVVGTYTLQFSATNGGGTSTDTAIITIRLSAPVVNAGADTSAYNGFAFTRTATESAGVPASRSWTIVSGPTGAATTIGTAATLSWTPTVNGTYTLRYSATNASGTGTDDVVVTVTDAPPVPVLIKQNTFYEDKTGTTVISVTLPSVSAGNGLVLMASTYTYGTGTSADVIITGITDTVGNTWVKAAEQRDTTTGYSGIWYCSASKASPSTLTLSVTVAVATYAAFNITEWSKSLTFASAGQTDATDPNHVVTVPNTVANELVVGGMNPYDNALVNVIAPATALNTATGSASLLSGYVLATGTSTTITWATSTSAAYVATGAAFTGSSPVTPPVVDAGADVSTTVNSVFTRTGTATNSPTSYAWTIQSGPTAVGTTIGTAAALSWTPTVVGTYTLRLSATNAGGTGTDDVIVTVAAAPTPVTIPYTETFTGTDGAALPAVWRATSGTATIQNNAAQISAPATGNYAAGRIDLISMPVLGDTDIAGTVTMATAAVEQYTLISINSDVTLGSGEGSNAYIAIIDYVNSTFQARNYTNGSYSTIIVETPITLPPANTPINFRVQRVGQTFRGRVWTGAEPTTWTISGTISGTPRTGRVSLGVDNGSNATSRTTIYDNITVSVPNASVTLPYTETFTGSDGFAWPSVWTQYVGGTSTIQGNAGTIVPTAGSYGTTIESLSVAPMADTEVSGTVIGSATGMEQYAFVTLNSDGTFNQYQTNNGYVFMLYFLDSTTSELGLYQESNGVETQLGSLTAQRFGSPANTSKSFRFQRMGQVLRGRYWNTIDPEPTTWDLSYTLPGTPLTGSVALSGQRGNAATGGTFTFDNVAVSVPAVASTGSIKAYVGGAFVAKPVKYWNGSAWTTKPIKRWTGTQWL